MAAAASLMASSSLVVVLLCAAAAAAAFFATADAKTADGDLVAKSCAGMMSHDWGWWFENEKFETRLRLDKRSAAAKHPRDLALIAMDLAQRAVADADAKVDGMLRSGAGHHSNDTALILRHCRLDYASVASTIPVCRAMVNDYRNPGVANRGQQLAPNDYFECARRLRRDTDKCLFRVLGQDVYKLVSKEIKEASKRTELVDAMLEEMLGIAINDHDPTLWI